MPYAAMVNDQWIIADGNDFDERPKDAAGFVSDAEIAPPCSLSKAAALRFVKLRKDAAHFVNFVDMFDRWCVGGDAHVTV